MSESRALMPSADYFRSAASYLREHGWKQFSFGSDGGPRCAIGAIRSSVAIRAASLPAQKRKGISRRLHNFANRYIADLGRNLPFGHRTADLMSYNDAAGRSAKEVIQLFEAMADELDLVGAIQCLTPTFLPEPSTGSGQIASDRGSSAPAEGQATSGPSTKGYSGEAQSNLIHGSARHIPPSTPQAGG